MDSALLYEADVKARLEGVRTEVRRLAGAVVRGEVPFPGAVDIIGTDAFGLLAYVASIFTRQSDWERHTDDIWFEGMRIALGAPSWISHGRMQWASSSPYRFSSLVLHCVARDRVGLYLADDGPIRRLWHESKDVQTTLVATGGRALAAGGIPEFSE